APPLPPGESVVIRHGRLSEADRAEIRAAAEEARADARETAAEARREAMRDAEEARREAAQARQEALADAAEARRTAFEATRVVRSGEVRAALVSARASVAGARGMHEADRRTALDSIDRALSNLDRDGGRGPTLQ
ncbi:hypothetical protein, partial [Rhizorhabdus wittichii]|uniref:hypothetical protein n=1 Tax=Rhizorhabdus wittichii TaxID=160791 RepID=UPI00036CFD5E